MIFYKFKIDKDEWSEQQVFVIMIDMDADLSSMKMINHGEFLYTRKN